MLEAFDVDVSPSSLSHQVLSEYVPAIWRSRLTLRLKKALVPPVNALLADNEVCN
jgi:hypothetical protein